ATRSAPERAPNRAGPGERRNLRRPSSARPAARLGRALPAVSFTRARRASQARAAPRQGGMAYIEPLPARTAGLFVRLVYWLVRRRLGRVPTPIGIMAHNRAVLSAVAGFELAFERGNALDIRLKELAQVKTATLVGCRFCIDI